MSIFLNADARILVQGITGAEGQKHTARMIEAGSNVVAGTNPRKAGQRIQLANRDLPIFGTVREAMAETDANVSVVFVPPQFAKSAMVEAADAGMPLVVVITEGIPVRDVVEAVARIEALGTTRLIGPNCPGIISPGQSVAGIIPAGITGQGPIGLVSKSGTLTYQLMHDLRDIGISTAIGIGGDPIVGTTHIDALAAFEADPATEAIVMIGEIGGDAEERAAEFIRTSVSKPVVAYIAGFSAPPGKTMGHAGAIVAHTEGGAGSRGTAKDKQAALEAAGVRVGTTPTETATLMRDLLRSTSR